MSPRGKLMDQLVPEWCPAGNTHRTGLLAFVWYRHRRHAPGRPRLPAARRA